jgi:NitT/TauT family transport system permease protein
MMAGRGARLRSVRPWRGINLEGVLFVLALVALWQLAVDTQLIESEFLPAPTEIVSAAGDLIDQGTLPADTWHTVWVTLSGWALAGALGITLGLGLGLWTVAWRYSMATVEFLRALPAISFVPVAVLLLGFSVRMELIVVVYVSVWPVLVATVHGVRCVTPLHQDLGAMLHLGPWARVRRLVLPTALPYIIIGLQLALGLALALALVAEMIGNPAGIGQALIAAQNTLQPEQMFAYVVLVGIIGWGLNALFLKLVAVALPGTSFVMRTDA